MKNIDFVAHSHLEQVAESLIQQGFSVIPIRGNANPANPKIPLVSWKKFQKQAAELDEISTWFEQDFTAIAIVCGSVSRLMVIDFDEEFAYQEFLRHFPTLAHTYTVKTRRGYHLYYRIQHRVLTQKFAGGDIKGEKSYVIAPPSLVNNFEYHVLENLPMQTLSHLQTEEILNRFCIADKKLDTSVSMPSSMDFVGLYQQLTSQLGRNNALYRVASIARQQDYPQEKFVSEMLLIHAHQAPNTRHSHETIPQRMDEGLKTIESAYSSGFSPTLVSGGLPNSIRESLLQKQNSTITARLLDAMNLSNWQAGTIFSLSQAIMLGEKFGLNRKSVMRVLGGNLSELEGNRIIPISSVDYYDSEGLKSSRFGRPIKIAYQVPSLAHLFRVLNVAFSPSDIITADDIQSAHQYRLALHREYIRRENPELPLSWLANRIGVNLRTVHRYNVELKVFKTKNLGYFPLSYSSLVHLPLKTRNQAKNATDGFWLETNDGHRYPAWKHIAFQLLKSGAQNVKVCKQLPSKLSLKPLLNTLVWQEISPSRLILSSLMQQTFHAVHSTSLQVSSALNRLLEAVKRQLTKVSYLTIPLKFDTVHNNIPSDDVAETINCYLYALDEFDREVRRPAKQGIAYRLLKEFGEGRVFLALRDEQMQVWYSLAKFAIKIGSYSFALRCLQSALMN